MNTNIEWVKVPYQQFKTDCFKAFNWDLKNQLSKDSILRVIYNNLKTPSRETLGSAGHDFKAPFSFSLKKGESILIPTGYSITLPKDKVLFILPRSGQGSKFKLEISNTCGVVDADYYRPGCSGGHIFIKLTYVGIDTVVPNFDILKDMDIPTTILEKEVTQPSEILDCKFVSSSPDKLTINIGDGIAQGIILDYYTAINELWDGGNFKGRHGSGNIANI